VNSLVQSILVRPRVCHAHALASSKRRLPSGLLGSLSSLGRPSSRLLLVRDDTQQGRELPDLGVLERLDESSEVLLHEFEVERVVGVLGDDLREDCLGEGLEVEGDGGERIGGWERKEREEGRERRVSSENARSSNWMDWEWVDKLKRK